MQFHYQKQNVGDDERDLFVFDVYKNGNQFVKTFDNEPDAAEYVSKMNKKEIPPPNWENTPESFLTRQSILEFCCVDFSPLMV